MLIVVLEFLFQKTYQKMNLYNNKKYLKKINMLKNTLPPPRQAGNLCHGQVHSRLDLILKRII